MALRRKECSKTWLSEFSSKALALLEQTSCFRQAACIGLYHALPGEVETNELIKRWSPHKTLLLPAIEGDDILLLPYSNDQALITGAYGIKEPGRTGCPSVSEKEIDLLIVPGVAFDRQGNRLGRGKGYYDRLLSRLNVPKVGLCFDFQLFPHIPTEPFDIRMDGIVTDKETINIK